MPLHGGYDPNTFPHVEKEHTRLGRPFFGSDVVQSAQLYTASIRYVAGYSGPSDEMREMRKMYHTKWGRLPNLQNAAKILNHLVNDLKDYTGNRIPPSFPHVPADGGMVTDADALKFMLGEKGKNSEREAGSI